MTCLKTKNTPTLRQQLREAAEQLDLPEGMLQGQPLLTWDGDLQLMIERHRGIIEYGEECIRVAAKDYTIRILGQRMHLSAMDRSSIRIRGRIHSVCYEYWGAPC